MTQTHAQRRREEPELDRWVEHYRVPFELEGRSGTARTRFPSNVVPASHLVAVEVVALGLGAAISSALSATGIPLWVPPTIIGIIGLGLVVRIGGHSLVDRILGSISGRQTRKRARPNAPVRAVELPDATPMALLSDGSTISTVIEVGGSGPTIAVGSSPEASRLPLEILADSLDQYDISLDSLDVVTAYSASAPRAWVTVRFSPGLDQPAVERRGGDDIGAERTITTATRRIVQRLSGAGFHASVLDQDAILRARDSLRGGRSHYATSPDGEAPSSAVQSVVGIATCLEGYAKATATPGATTLMRLRGHDRGERVLWSAAARFHVPSAESAPTLPAGIERQKLSADALVATIAPGSATGTFELPVEQSDYSTLADGSPVLSSASQVVGVNAAGAAISIRFGAGHIGTLHVDASPYTSAQVVLRALGSGARVSMATTRPQYWEPFLREFGHGPRARFHLHQPGHIDHGEPGSDTANGTVIAVEDGVGHTQRESMLAVVSFGSSTAPVAPPPYGARAHASLSEDSKMPGSGLLSYGETVLEIGLIHRTEEDRILGFYR